MSGILTTLAIKSITKEEEIPTNETQSTYELSDKEKEAKKYLTSSLIPERWRNLSDMLLIIEMAEKMNVPKTSVAQNLVSYKGERGWKSTFIISCINTSKNFKSLLKFKEVGNPNDDSWGYYAFATDLDNDIVKSPVVTVAMAKEQGWYDNEGSKWSSMTELMLQYRAAALFGRLYASEILMGMQSAEEIHDIDNGVVTIIDDKEIVLEELEEINSDCKPLPKEIVEKVSRVEEVGEELLSTKKPRVSNDNKQHNEAKEEKPYELTDEFNALIDEAVIYGFDISEPTVNSKGEYWVKAEPSDVFADYDALLNEAKFEARKKGLHVRNVTNLLRIKS